MSTAASDPTQQVLAVPFRLRGFEGQVVVHYGVNTDPRRWGFGLLELPFDLELVRGFPVCKAEVAFSGPGYYAVMGWIQLVTVREASGESWVAIDQLPNHHGLETPFAPFGYLPTLFDAPGPNPPRSDETWLAESFLVACPDVARTRTVEAVTGFGWGYRLEATKPSLLPARRLAAERWDEHIPYLAERFPSWSFVPVSEAADASLENWSKEA